jgi:hypothetical protein
MFQKYSFHKLILLFIAIVIVGSSCQKNNGIDNNSILKIPYTMYTADTSGNLYYTNDGINYRLIQFPSDGYPSRSLLYSDSNVLWVKVGINISTPNIRNFNLAFKDVNPLPVWQPLAYDSKSHGRVYLSIKDPIPTHSGSLWGNGVAYNDSNGAINHWHPDTSWDVSPADANIHLTSFTEMRSGIVVGLDHISNRIFYRVKKSDRWKERIDTTGIYKLPISAATAFYLGHINNLVVAADYNGVGGVWYSGDTGQTWKQYAGIPNRKIYSIGNPFDQVLMVGTDSAGIYYCKQQDLLSGTPVFAPANTGFVTPYTSVRGIVEKLDVYKNSETNKYIYVATNTGVYRSTDLGQSWIRVKTGNYVSMY